MDRETEMAGCSALATELARSPEWHVWVKHYSLTHHSMALFVHTGDYPRTGEVVLLDCVRFHGHFQGGPYALKLAEASAQDEAGLYELVSADGQFQVVFGRARVVSRFPSVGSRPHS